MPSPHTDGCRKPYEIRSFCASGQVARGLLFPTPAREDVRLAVNTWIRDSGAFDAVVDFDAGIRDPERPARMLPIYDCGDHLHPSDLGYNRMGDIIDLSLFDSPR